MLQVLHDSISLFMGTGEAVDSNVDIRLWIDDVGLLCTNTMDDDLYLVGQLDGLLYIRSSRHMRGSNALVFDFPAGDLLFKYTDQMDRLAVFDGYGGVPKTVVFSGGVNHVANILCRVTDRYLYVYDNTLQYSEFSTPSTWVSEYTFSGAATGATEHIPSVSPTEYSDIICFVWSNGTVAYYNWVTKTEVLTRKYLPTNLGAWYSPLFGIFIVKISARVFSIYAAAPRPDSLSSPVALTPILKGKSSDVQVRVLGSNNEPCIGEIVTWSLSGTGALDPLQSITNSDGYAVTKYRAPLYITDTPSVTASVKF